MPTFSLRRFSPLLIALCLLPCLFMGRAGAQTLLKTLTWTGPIAANATAGSTAVGANQVDVQGGVASVSAANALVLTTDAGGLAFFRDDLYFSDIAASSTQKYVMTAPIGANLVGCKLMYQASSRSGYYVHVTLGTSGGTPGVTVYKITGSPASSYATVINNVSFSPAYNNSHSYQVVAQATGSGTPSTVITISVFDVTASGADPTNTTDASPVSTATYTDTSSPFTSGAFALSTLNGCMFSKVRIYGTAVSPIVITAPAPNQVFQRTSSGTASMSITGTNSSGATHSIEASFNGGAYQTVAANVAANTTFTGTLTNQTQGQGILTARFVDATGTTFAVSPVGIGDVWIIAGQSNGSGRGTNNQLFNNGQGVLAGLFGNDYSWKTLSDPTDSVTGQVDTVSNDSVGGTAPFVGGSVWPLIASQSTAILKLPVAFVPCALGGSGITAWQPGANHQDRTTLYGSMVYRGLSVGGVKGVLWWQGETDSVNNMTQSAYVSNMAALASAIRTDLGCKLIPCKLQNFGGGAAEAAINAAIAQEWATDPNVLPGADLSDMVTDAGYHFFNDGNMLTASSRWWNAINKDFYAPASGGTKRRIQ